MKVTKDKWVWMPHAAHYICADKCRFFMATKVGRYIVSTVGEYWPDRAVREIHARIHDPEWHAEHNHLKGDYYDHEYMKRFGFEEVGYKRLYETMVFKSKKSDNGCCPYVIKNATELEMDVYNEASEAYKGHMKMCRTYANK